MNSAVPSAEQMDASPSRAPMTKPATIPRPKNLPGRKDTKKWCRGKVGREHQLEVIPPHNMMAFTCSPSRWSSAPWSCMHQERCTVCGKILHWFLPWRRCPDLPAELAH